MLISVITKDITMKRTKKVITNTDIMRFMELRGIPSFIEVRLDNKKNFNILDQHLRFIMNPSYN